jgi:hypothetical protein
VEPQIRAAASPAAACARYVGPAPRAAADPGQITPPATAEAKGALHLLAAAGGPRRCVGSIRPVPRSRADLLRATSHCQQSAPRRANHQSSSSPAHSIKIITSGEPVSAEPPKRPNHSRTVISGSCIICWPRCHCNRRHVANRPPWSYSSSCQAPSRPDC